jgi:hypothetical protein
MSIKVENLSINNSPNNQYVSVQLLNPGDATVYNAKASISQNGLSNLNANQLLKLDEFIHNSFNNSSTTIDSNNATAQLEGVVNTFLSDQNVKKRDELELLQAKQKAIGVDRYPPFSSSSELEQSIYSTPPAFSYNPNEDKSVQLEQQRQQVLSGTLVGAQNASKKSTGANGSNGTNLTSTLSGSDLSVFFLTEIPNIEDVNNNVAPYLWRKEIMLLELDSVMSFTYSIVREVFPVRTIGTSKPKSYTRGPIGIAGSICFSVFTEDVLVRLRTQMQDSINNYRKSLSTALNNYKAKDNSSILNKAKLDAIDSKMNEINIYKQNLYDDYMENGGSDASYTSDNLAYEKQLNDLNTQRAAIESQQKYLDNRNVSAKSTIDNLSETYAQYNKALNAGGIYMLNQLIPFNLLIMGTNEQGTFSKMMLKGVRIIDENQMQGVQQPNIVNKITFSAEDIFPLISGTSSDTTLDFTSISSKDQNSPTTSNPYSIYTGSQLMKDVAAMSDRTYSLALR